MTPTTTGLLAAAAGIPGWLLVLHVASAIVYGGSLAALTRLLVSLSKQGDAERTATASAGRRTYLLSAFPASVVLFITGLYVLFADPGEAAYMQQGWFHVKLTLVVLLLIVDQVLVMRPFKRISLGTCKGDVPRSGGLFLAAHLGCLLCLAGIVVALYVLRG